VLSADFVREGERHATVSKRRSIAWSIPSRPACDG
jgi:hypothetical protein